MNLQYLILPEFEALYTYLLSELILSMPIKLPCLTVVFVNKIGVATEWTLGSEIKIIRIIYNISIAIAYLIL